MRYRWTDHLNELGVRSYLTPSDAQSHLMFGLPPLQLLHLFKQKVVCIEESVGLEREPTGL